jgi:parallel beta-helix repeat protein
MTKRELLLSTAIFLGLTVGILFRTIGTVDCTSGWSITVQTDRPCYVTGDTVCIWGRLTYNDWPQQNVQVGIGVKSLSSGTPYYFGTATTDSDGNYNSSFTLGINAEPGTYVVSANAEGHANQTTFLVADPIYIKESGDVEPADAPISRNGNTYTLTDNIVANSTKGIIIERNDIILNGMGFTLNGTRLANSNGIYLSRVSNVTIENISIESFQNGVNQYYCPDCHIVDTNLFSNGNGIYYQQASSSTIEGNNITKNGYAGILLDGSNDNNISGNSLANTISSNFGAISLRGSSYNNNIADNNFANNTLYGVYIEASYSNTIFHNNFLNNTRQGFVTPDSSGNLWDNGYPSGGNFWSDYKGADLFNGPYQNVTGSDAMGDTPYLIGKSNIDHYPLMQPWTGMLAQSLTSIIFSVNPAPVGSPVTCTATVSGSNPTGIVTWITGSITGNFSNSNCMLSSGNCSTTYIDTSPGTVTITANYSGDLNNAQNSSSNTLTVSPVTTFDQVGVGSDFTGTVVTIDGTYYTASELPVSFLWVEGSSHSFSYASPLSAGIGERYVWNSTSGLSGVQNGSLNVAGSGILTGNYDTQYYLTLATSPSGVDSPSGQGWYDAGSYASISTVQYIDIVSGSSRYTFSGWTTDNMTEIADPSLPATTVLMDRAKTVTANLVTQYYVTFTESGVGSDFLGSVMNVSGTDYDRSGYSDWFDSGASVAFSFYSPLVVTPNGRQYVLVSPNVTSPLNVSAATTVTGTYKTQYSITFDQSGVGPDCIDTVVVIDGSNYSFGALPASFWWDEGSTHTFAFQSALVGASGTKRYNWTSTTGLSSLQSSSITVTSLGTVNGNYVTLVHDIAVTSVVAGKSVVCQGYGCAIEAALANTGDLTETFNVTIYANMTNNGNVTAIHTFVNVPLNSHDSTILIFTWDTTGFVTGNYTINAYAEPVPSETDTADNNFTGGWVLVARVGDLNGDDKCDGRDIIIVARAFESYGPDYYYPGSPATLGWNPNADITNDNKVDGRDLIIMSRHFGAYNS